MARVASATGRNVVPLSRIRRSRLVADTRETLYSRTSYSSMARAARNAREGGSNVQAAGLSGVPSGRGIFGNFAKDVLDSVTGVPSFAVLTSKLAAYPAVRGLEATGGLTRGTSDRWEREFKQAGDAIVADYKYRYGPAFEGDWDTFGERSREHPGLLALDVATVWSGAGAGVRAGAAGAKSAGLVSATGRVARLADRSVMPAGTAVKGGRVSTGARYRGPLVREVKLGENSSLTSRVEIPRRPLSRNPLTRELIQRPTERLRSGFSDFLEQQGNASRAGERSLLGRPARVFSTQSRFNRVVARRARDMRYAAELTRAGDVRRETAGMLEASRGVKGGSSADWAARLHAQGLLDVPGMKPREARDRVILMMRQGLDEAVGGRSSKSRGAQRQIDAIAKIPDEYLNLDTAPPKLRTLVEEERRVANLASDARVAAGTITRETAEAVGRRPAEMVFGDSRYDPRLVRETPRVVAARTAYDAAVAARDAGPRLGPVAAARRSFRAGRIAGRGDRNVELARPLQGNRRVPVMPNMTEGATAPATVAITRGPGITARQGAAYGQRLRGEGKGYNVRVALKESGRRARAVRTARSELRAAEREARGGWTTPTRTDLPKGAYFPDNPVDRRAGSRTSGNPTSQLGRLTQDRVHQSVGTLFRTGNVSADPRNLVKALDRALVDSQHPQFMRTVIDAFAFKDKDGHVAVGSRALRAMEADPDHVVLASRKNLEDAMRLAQDAPEGAPPTDPFRGMDLLEGPEGLARSRALPASTDVIALPKAAVDAVRQGWTHTPGGPKWRIYDTPLQLWRRGILAFAPRWYLNNLFGNTLQFGLLTGFDFRAIRQARQMDLRGVAAERLGGSTLVEDVRMSDPMSDAGRVRQGFERASDKGMNFNHKLEGVIRQAALVSRARRGLKAEGVNVGKMSPDELARAIEEMPEPLLNDVLSDVELFMGDYVRMSPIERATLKRVFPFYSWMRVIGKLMAVVPFRHPKRVALVATVSQAANDVLNPNDYMLDLYDRGRINLPGGLAQRTASMNPLTTHAELLANLASGNPATVAGGLARDFTPIGVQQGVQLVTGRNTFGRPFSAPPGYGGAAQAFGFAPTKINPATGLPEEHTATPSIFELGFQSLPLVPGLVRGIASSGRTPYDTTSTLALVNNLVGGGNDDPRLFLPESDGPRASMPLAVGGVPLSPVLSLTGINPRRVNREAEAQRYYDRIRRQREADAQTAKRVSRGR